VKLNTAHPAYVLAFTAAISAVFTAAIMTLHQATADRVARNEALRGQKALVEVFGLGDPEAMTAERVGEVVASRIERGETITDPQTGREIEVIRAYDRDRTDPAARLVGIAFPVSGMGFWEPIRGLLAVTPDLNTVIGIVFLRHGETPGLGARIEEEAFRRPWEGLNVSSPAQGRRYVYVGGGEPSGPGDPRQGRHVDAITGATQTSLAVERFVNASIRRFRRAARAAGLGGTGSGGATPQEP